MRDTEMSPLRLEVGLPWVVHGSMTQSGPCRRRFNITCYLGVAFLFDPSAQKWDLNPSVKAAGAFAFSLFCLQATPVLQNSSSHEASGSAPTWLPSLTSAFTELRSVANWAAVSMREEMSPVAQRDLFRHPEKLDVKLKVRQNLSTGSFSAKTGGPRRFGRAWLRRAHLTPLRFERDGRPEERVWRLNGISCLAASLQRA